MSYPVSSRDPITGAVEDKLPKVVLRAKLSSSP